MKKNHGRFKLLTPVTARRIGCRTQFRSPVVRIVPRRPLLTKVVIVNDTSRYNHFGCRLVMDAIHKQCRRVGFDVRGTIYANQRNYLKELRGTPDLVIVNGEGSLHDDRRPDLLEIAKHFPAVLINTVFYRNSWHDGLRLFKLVSVRESLSQRALAEFGVDAIVTPDACYASDIVGCYARVQPIRDLGVTDSVRDRRIGELKARTSPDAFVRDLLTYRRVCTGRFHGAVICSLFGIPFSAWPSNSHKIEGLMTDMGIPHLHFPTLEQAVENVPDVFEPSIKAYVDSARSRIENLFDRMASL